MGTDPYADDLTARIDAAIAEVYRTESLSRAESHGAMRALGAFGAPAVDRVLELYRGSTTGPHEHARLLNGLGTSAVDAQAAARVPWPGPARIATSTACMATSRRTRSTS